MSRIDQETGEILDYSEPSPESNTYEVDIVTGAVTSSVYTDTERGIAELRQKYPATLTSDDYPLIVIGVKEIRKKCINLEVARKEIKAPFLRACTAIDREAKRITLALEKISDPMIEIKKQVDDAKAIAEAQRIADLDAKASLILRIAADAEHGTLAEISAALERVSAIDTLSGFYERQLVACENKASAMATLKSALIRRNEHEKRDRDAELIRIALAAAQAELARSEVERLAQADELATLRAESEQRKRVAHEEFLRGEAEKNAHLALENITSEKLAEIDAEQNRREANRSCITNFNNFCDEVLMMINRKKTVIDTNRSAYDRLADAIVTVRNDVNIEIIGE